ncbi:uncharacterized protein BO72DRAFT_513142 [Aspergillus fijiensis CBS 313.89]|uniref:Uncharacterized protein n=1 Tax=Aspergillus fijiensis CBS 313.89 TaxID=1448319 RepID=A0A8G1VXW3_9EURO|nr:uncharacterized protein BO72DRAFT_513142 [Aspergillus fijiensis CBS 313.89]RAK75676.1 hypothetical protein BO72DRAFT_513142 [Aspergillus fijiensis CBS 313.89]
MSFCQPHNTGPHPLDQPTLSTPIDPKMEQPLRHGLNAEQSPARRLLFLICPGGYSFVQQYPTVLARLASWARLVCVTSEADFVRKWNVWISDPTYRVAGFVLVDGAIFESRNRHLMRRLVELPRRIVPYQRPLTFSTPVDSRWYDQAPNPEFRYAVALNAALWAGSHPTEFNHWLYETWQIKWQVMPGVSAAAPEFYLGRVARETADLIIEAWFQGAFLSRAVFVTGPPVDPYRVCDHDSVLHTCEDVLLRTPEEADAEYQARMAAPRTTVAPLERDSGVLHPDVEPIYTQRTDENPVTFPMRPLQQPQRRRWRGARILREHHAATLNVNVAEGGAPNRIFAFIGLIDDIPEVGGLILDICNIHDGEIQWTAPELSMPEGEDEPYDAADERPRRVSRPHLEPEEYDAEDERPRRRRSRLYLQLE